MVRNPARDEPLKTVSGTKSWVAASTTENSAVVAMKPGSRTLFMAGLLSAEAAICCAVRKRICARDTPGEQDYHNTVSANRDRGRLALLQQERRRKRQQNIPRNSDLES